MIELKALSQDHVDAALKKAIRYRLLNEPRDAESICLDVLEVDPNNQEALVTLLLSLTDQFGNGGTLALRRALDVLLAIEGVYSKHYYAGLIHERKAKAILDMRTPGARSRAYDEFSEAMREFEKADELATEDNDDPSLRWNACARIMNAEELEPAREERSNEMLE